MGVLGVVALAVLASWMVMGLVIFLAVRRYRSGMGCLSSVLWFFWTELWLAVLATSAASMTGATGALLVYLGYAAWHINAIIQVRRADSWLTSQYGSLTWHRVKYLGGHPGFRDSHVKVVLLVTRSGLVLLDKYRTGARTLCVVPVDRISQAESHGTTTRFVAWSSDMIFPMTFTTDQGTLAVQFVNDVGGLSVASFDVGGAGTAQALKSQVDYAVYDWRRSCMGREPAPVSP